MSIEEILTTHANKINSLKTEFVGLNGGVRYDLVSSGGNKAPFIWTTNIEKAINLENKIIFVVATRSKTKATSICYVSDYSVGNRTFGIISCKYSNSLSATWKYSLSTQNPQNPYKPLTLEAWPGDGDSPNTSFDEITIYAFDAQLPS